MQTLGEKDLRDVRPAVLREALDAGGGVSPSDEFSMQYLLCPRIGTEPLSCWRRTLADSFPEARKREFREAPDALWRWIRESIRQAPQTEYRQLVTLPAGVMRLRCADLPSQRLLFVAVCRTLGIPARLNPAGGAAEYALDGQFFSPEAGRTANARLQLQKQPGQTWQPGADFGLSAFENGAWQPMAVPGQWDGARLTLSLSPGVYRVITDSRLPNGDLHAMRMELRLEAEQEACVQLQKQAVSLAEQAVDFTLADFQAEAPDGHQAAAAELTRTQSLLMWLEEGREPTEHLLNELLSSRAQLARLPLRLIFSCAADRRFKTKRCRPRLPPLRGRRSGSRRTLRSLRRAAPMWSRTACRFCCCAAARAVSAMPAPDTASAASTPRWPSAGRTGSRQNKKPLPPARGGSGFCLHIHL